MRNNGKLLRRYFAGLNVVWDGHYQAKAWEGLERNGREPLKDWLSLNFLFRNGNHEPSGRYHWLELRQTINTPGQNQFG
jgi:hypothetical protein